MVACVAPLARQDVIDSVQFSIAFFATLLTGEAVIFAISFSPSSGWPSLREIDSHIAFREWVVAGWVAAMLTAIGLLGGTAIPATYGALLFLLADAFGMFSFIRLFSLASADGRKRLLCRTLADGLARVSVPPAGLRQRMSADRVLNAYLGQLDEAAARSDGNGVRDLADELAEASAARGCPAAAALRMEVVQWLARAALVGKLDPVVASGAAEMLIGSLLPRASAGPPDGDADPTAAQRAAAVMGQASRYLAWLASTSLNLSAREVTTAGAARELVALSVRVRHHILRVADPDPPYAAGTADQGTPLSGAVSVLAWISGFTEFHGSHQAAGLYPVYEILTGTKFLGNYWDGDSVLTGLRARCSPRARPQTQRRVRPAGVRHGGPVRPDLDADLRRRDRDAARCPAGPSTRADPARVHPRPPAARRLSADLRLAPVLHHRAAGDDRPRQHRRPRGPAWDLWPAIQATAAPIGWSVPMPAVEPHQRPSAYVLAIASRLAPLAAGEPDQQLRAFLAGLPRPVLGATARLATRALPDPETEPCAAQAGYGRVPNDGRPVCSGRIR